AQGCDGRAAPAPPSRSHLVKRRSARSVPASPQKRVLGFLLLLGMIIAAWWGSGYLFAYTDDAYLTSDIVSITPEVSGPINAVHVTDNQWVSRGTLLFTIDPVPFQLALERARAQ